MNRLRIPLLALAALLFIALTVLPGSAPVVLAQTVPGGRVLMPMIARGGSTATATRTQTPTQTPTPTNTRVPVITNGDKIRFQGFHGKRLEGTIVSNFYSKTINGGTCGTDTAAGIFLIIRFNVLNADTTSEYWYSGSIGALRVYEPAYNRTFDQGEFNPQWDAECQYGYQSNRIGDSIQPGTIVPRIVVFGVAAQGSFQLQAVNPW